METIKIIRKKIITKSRVKGYYISKLLQIGETKYDLNYFTDSGSSLVDMRISNQGTKLKIWIDSDWFDKDTTSIISILKRSCVQENIEFPFVEISFILLKNKE